MDPDVSRQRENPPPGRPRVVSLIASSTEMVAALGCGELLVGRSHECDYPPWVKRLPAVTAPAFPTAVPSGEIDRSVRHIVENALAVYAVDAAALAALHPDVVITQVQCAVCAVTRDDVEEALAAVTASRPRLVALEPNALADIWRDIERVAEALAVPERGAALVRRLQDRMHAVAARAASLPRPRVACIEWIDPLMAAGNWTPELVAMAGGADFFGLPGAHAPMLAWEALVAADPDVLLIAPCGFDLARTRTEMGPLLAHPGWPQLRAVRERRVYLGDGNAFFNRPGPRVAETLEIVAEILHREIFAFGHEGTGWEQWTEADAPSLARGGHGG